MTPFEMNEIKFHIKLPIFVARQWIRHRATNVNEYSQDIQYSITNFTFQKLMMLNLNLNQTTKEDMEK